MTKSFLSFFLSLNLFNVDIYKVQIASYIFTYVANLHRLNHTNAHTFIKSLFFILHLKHIILWKRKKNHCLKQILHLHDAPSQLFIKSLKISKFSAVLICNGKEFQIFGAKFLRLFVPYLT